jgi:hypothetical protein
VRSLNNTTSLLSRLNSLDSTNPYICPRLPYITFEALKLDGFTLNERENGQGLVSFGGKWYVFPFLGGGFIDTDI